MYDKGYKRNHISWINLFVCKKYFPWKQNVRVSFVLDLYSSSGPVLTWKGSLVRNCDKYCGPATSQEVVLSGCCYFSVFDTSRSGNNIFSLLSSKLDSICWLRPKMNLRSPFLVYSSMNQGIIGLDLEKPIQYPVHHTSPHKSTSPPHKWIPQK